MNELEKGDIPLNRLKLTSAVLGLLTACLTASVRAGEPNKDTDITTNQGPQAQDTCGRHVFKSIEPGVVIDYNTDRNRSRGPITGWSVYRADPGDEQMLSVSQSQLDQAATPNTTTEHSPMRRYIGAALGALLVAFVKLLTSESSFCKRAGSVQES